MHLRVIAVGNSMRGDDAVALAVLDWLEAVGATEGVEKVRYDGDWAGLTSRLMGADGALVLDVVQGAGEPGTIITWDIGHTSGVTVAQAKARLSGHGLGLAEAFEMCRLLGRLPCPCIFVGIEGQDFAFGHPISGPVAKALPALVEKARAAIGRLEEQCTRSR